MTDLTRGSKSIDSLSLIRVKFQSTYSIEIFHARTRCNYQRRNVVDGTGDPAFVGAIAVKGEREVVVPTLKGFEPLQGNQRFALAQVAVVTLAWIGLAAYTTSVYPGLPDIIPVHFGLNGIPNRWGGKVELVWFAGVAALFPALNAVFALRFDKDNKGVSAFLGFVFVLALGFFALIAYMMVQAA